MKKSDNNKKAALKYLLVLFRVLGSIQKNYCEESYLAGQEELVFKSLNFEIVKRTSNT